MPSEERNAYIALIAGVISVLYFGAPIWAKTVGGAYDVADGLALWGVDVLWLIGGGIVLTIVAVIVVHILLAIVFRDHDTDGIMDERDRMIGRHGILVTLVCISAGFVIAVIGLALGWSAVAGLNTILAGMIVGSFASEVFRIGYYRIGS